MLFLFLSLSGTSEAKLLPSATSLEPFIRIRVDGDRLPLQFHPRSVLYHSWANHAIILYATLWLSQSKFSNNTQVRWVRKTTCVRLSGIWKNARCAINITIVSSLSSSHPSNWYYRLCILNARLSITLTNTNTHARSCTPNKRPANATQPIKVIFDTFESRVCSSIRWHFPCHIFPRLQPRYLLLSRISFSCTWFLFSIRSTHRLRCKQQRNFPY